MRKSKTKPVHIPWDERIVVFAENRNAYVTNFEGMPASFCRCGLGTDPTLPKEVRITIASPANMMLLNNLEWNYVTKAKAVVALLNYEKKSVSRETQAVTEVEPFEDWEP